MRLGLRVPACARADEVADFISRAERAGFDEAWVPDTQLLSRDVWITLALAAERTSRIAIGTNVTNPLTRHASVTASAAATVDELSAGRCLVGIGSGHSSVRVMGWETARLAQMRDYIGLLRPLWKGAWVEPYGRSFRLKGATGRPIPIYVAATGPKMLQLAGELADGVILMVGLARESLEYGLANIEIGARRAGRRLEDLDIAVGAFCHIGDWQIVKRLAQPYAANYAIRHRVALRDSGIPVPEAGDESGIYPDLIHAEDWDRAIELTGWVPEEVAEAFAEKFCLMGTGTEVAQKIRGLESAGVNHLFIRGLFTYELPDELLDTFARDVIK